MLLHNSEADFHRRSNILVTLWLNPELATISFECSPDAHIWDDELFQAFHDAIWAFNPQFFGFDDDWWSCLGISAADSERALAAAVVGLSNHGFRTNILTDAVEIASRRTH